MVASSQPLASKIGLQILQQGGTAVDAAIAANATLGLCEPHMCGMGGDLYAIVWNAEDSQLYGLNASGRSPATLDFDTLQQRLQDEGYTSIPMQGLLSVSVPGAVDGWFELHKRFGSLSMEALLEPVIDAAENGFKVTPVIAGEWQQFSDREKVSELGSFHGTYRPQGRAPDNGELFRNPDLANSYRLIAQQGRAGYYEGELAEQISNFMKAEGGYLQRDDFSAHRSDWVSPLSVKYRACDVFELPPNGQGLAALQMLKMMDGFDFSSAGFQSVEAIHFMIEAKKLAFEDRARFYADPDFSPAPLQALISDSYARERAQLISTQAAQEVKAGDPILRQSDTVYLTTADNKGNMVSLIQSIFHPFGSAVVVPGTGFALQNRGLLFSMDAQHPNVYAPAKRPFQTIIPGFIMRDGKPFISFGVMGGDMQPQGHAQVISNILDFNMDLQDAGDALRWRHDGSTQPTGKLGESLQDGGSLVLEDGYPEALIRELEKRGHRLAADELGFGFGGYQAIMLNDSGGYTGATENRKDGCVMAY